MNSEEIDKVLEYHGKIERNNMIIRELEDTIASLRDANSIMGSIIAETISKNGGQVKEKYIMENSFEILHENLANTPDEDLIKIIKNTADNTNRNGLEMITHFIFMNFGFKFEGGHNEVTD